MFALNVATKLWRAGLEPQLGTHTDLVCQIAGKSLVIECKHREPVVAEIGSSAVTTVPVLR